MHCVVPALYLRRCDGLLGQLIGTMFEGPQMRPQQLFATILFSVLRFLCYTLWDGFFEGPRVVTLRVEWFVFVS